MTGPLPDAARAFLAQSALDRLWAAARSRLERNGLEATGTIKLRDVGFEERNALSLLLARPVTRPEVTIRLAELDQRLRATAAGRGLVGLLGELGPPLSNRRAARTAARAERIELWSAAEAHLSTTCLVDRPWAQQWLDEARRGGAVARQLPDAAAATLHQAIQILSLLFAPAPAPAWGRGELATRATGSAHGLDDDTLLSRLVLRGIARAHGAEFPGDAAGRRALWRLGSVTPDEVSSTVLTYGLRPTGGAWRESALRERADHSMETHLTLRELRSLELAVHPGTRIHICENPRIVEAAADAGCTRPLVCTSGSAATAVLTLLDMLMRSGSDCAFAYHGDFDWPGIALANRIVGRYKARPWRMSADDYEHLLAHVEALGSPQLALSGSPEAADWDPELHSAMQEMGIALHEESAIDFLLEDLA